MVLVVLEHPLVKQIMVCVALVLLIIHILLVRERKKRCLIILFLRLGIRLLDGRITTLLEARALTLFAVNVSIKSASWG